MLEEIDQARRTLYSKEEYDDALPAELKQLRDFLCLNHARYLWGVEYPEMAETTTQSALPMI